MHLKIALQKQSNPYSLLIITNQTLWFPSTDASLRQLSSHVTIASLRFFLLQPRLISWCLCYIQGSVVMRAQAFQLQWGHQGTQAGITGGCDPTQPPHPPVLFVYPVVSSQQDRIFNISNPNVDCVTPWRRKGSGRSDLALPSSCWSSKNNTTAMLGMKQLPLSLCPECHKMNWNQECHSNTCSERAHSAIIKLWNRILLFSYCLKCHVFTTPTSQRSPRGMIRGDPVSINEVSVWMDKSTSMWWSAHRYLHTAIILTVHLIPSFFSREQWHLTENSLWRIKKELKHLKHWTFPALTA